MDSVEVAPERLGMSVALYVMPEAPSNADTMVVHLALPHWSMDLSLAALAASVPRTTLVKSPDIRTV